MVDEVKDLECECGMVHRLATESIVVEDVALEKLILAIKNSEYKNIALLSSHPEGDVVENIKSVLDQDGKYLNVISIPSCLATLNTAEKIEDKGQDLVVAIGGEEIISVAKFYAYSYDCDLYIYVTHDFTDFTFSSFARLYDGVQFDFYKTVPPKHIYVDTSVNKYNVYHTYYISSKMMGAFDNVVQEIIFEKPCCHRQKEFLNNLLKTYMFTKPISQIEFNKKNIWTLIRIGQGMSFYGQTKNFFSGDLPIVNLLQSKRLSASFLELESIALKLVINSYSCFYTGQKADNGYNLNKQIRELSKFLKISQTEVLKRLSSIVVSLDKSRIDFNMDNYFPYLKGVFNKALKKVFYMQSSVNLPTNILKKYDLDYEIVEKSFALSSCLYSRFCSLHLLALLGYLDKLL